MNNGPWFRDPDGLLHLMGLIEPSHDWTECGREMAGVEGWRAVLERKSEPLCALCEEVVGRRQHSTFYAPSVQINSGNAQAVIPDCGHAAHFTADFVTGRMGCTRCLFGENTA